MATQLELSTEIRNHLIRQQPLPNTGPPKTTVVILYIWYLPESIRQMEAVMCVVVLVLPLPHLTPQLNPPNPNML